MTHFSCDSEIDRVGRGLLDRSLPKAEWTHAGHFAAAIWVLRRPDMDAARDMPGLIRAYNEATGVHNTDSTGYHETITLASLRAARAWLVHDLTHHCMSAERAVGHGIRTLGLVARLLVEAGVVLGRGATRVG